MSHPLHAPFLVRPIAPSENFFDGQKIPPTANLRGDIRSVSSARGEMRREVGEKVLVERTRLVLVVAEAVRDEDHVGRSRGASVRDEFSECIRRRLSVGVVFEGDEVEIGQRVHWMFPAK